MEQNRFLKAIKIGDVQEIGHLVTQAKADINNPNSLYIKKQDRYLYKTDVKKNTPFHLALQNKNNKIGTFFALMHKTEKNNQEIEDKKRNRIELRRQNLEGNTVLHIVARKGYAEYREVLDRLYNGGYLTKKLLKKKNIDNYTAYFIAKATFHIKIANILQEAEKQIQDLVIIHSIDINEHNQRLTPDEAQGKLLRKLKENRGSAFRNAFSHWFLISFGIALSSSIISIISVDPCCKEGNQDIFRGIKGAIFGLSLMFSFIGIYKAHESYKKTRQGITTYNIPVGKNPRFWVPLGSGIASLTLLGLGLSEEFGQPTSATFTAIAPLINTMFLGRTEAVIKEETSGLKNLTHTQEQDFLKDIILAP